MSEAAKASATEPLIVGRYALFDELASGGMATVHLGRLLGPVGFGRTVAIKRLHSHYLKDQEFITMFMDEARIVARIRHPNVVPMVDVVQSPTGLFLVMEYVHGESLSKLMRSARSAGEKIPFRIVTAILSNTLHGLHAAHETKGPTGELLGVVHRDVSPQNVIVGADGVARVLDFGIAKAAGRAQVTREGQIKGKLAYMAPEQIRGQVDRRTDVFAAAVCLWEALTGRRLHEGLKDVEIVTRIVAGKYPPPSQFAPDVPPALDQIVLRGLVPDPKKRFSSAKEMALEIEQNVGLATPTEVSAFVERLASDVLKKRQERLSAIELSSADLIPDESAPPPPSLAMPIAGVGASGTQSLLDQPSTGDSPPPSAGGGAGDSAFGQTHTQTTTAGAALMSDVQPTRPEEEEDAKAPMIQWVVLAACAVLAIVGAILGGVALFSKKNTAGPGPSAVPSATAPVVVPPSAEAPPSAVPTTQLAPNTAPSGAPSAGGAGAAAAHDAASKGEADAGASGASGASGVASAAAPSASASSKTAPSASASAKPNPWAAPPATSKKKNCDPPYTTDSAGRKHYKPECFDTF